MNTKELGQTGIMFPELAFGTWQYNGTVDTRDVEPDVLPYCQANGITVLAFSPLGRGPQSVLNSDSRGALDRISQETGKTKVQIALNWCLCKEQVIPITTASSIEHVEENWGAVGWRLSREHVRAQREHLFSPAWPDGTSGAKTGAASLEATGAALTLFALNFSSAIGHRAQRQTDRTILASIEQSTAGKSRTFCQWFKRKLRKLVMSILLRRLGVMSSQDAMSMQPAELSVVIPTFNERGNLGELIKRITAALEGIRWEVIVVDDDSPDGAVPAELRSQWRILRYADRQALPRALKGLGTIDMCHYDSDKSYEGRMWAYPILWKALKRIGTELALSSATIMSAVGKCCNQFVTAPNRM